MKLFCASIVSAAFAVLVLGLVGSRADRDEISRAFKQRDAAIAVMAIAIKALQEKEAPKKDIKGGKDRTITR